MEKSSGVKEKKSVMTRIREFILETVAEMKRCTWPDRHQLLESTILVVVVMLLLACFVAGVDELARLMIKMLTVGSN